VFTSTGIRVPKTHRRRHHERTHSPSAGSVRSAVSACTGCRSSASVTFSLSWPSASRTTTPTAHTSLWLRDHPFHGRPLTSRHRSRSTHHRPRSNRRRCSVGCSRSTTTQPETDSGE
jgi:hypothetical protein